MRFDYAPKGIGRLVDEAIALYRAEFRTLVVPAAYLLLPLALVMNLVQTRLTVLTTASIQSQATEDPALFLATFSIVYAALIALTVIIGLGALYYESCLLRATPSLLARESVAPAAFLKGGWRRFGYLVLAVIVVAFIVGAGYVFLFVPGLILIVYASLVLPLTVVEDASPGDAVTRSFTLVSGNFWRVVGFLIASTAVVYALQSAFTSLAVIPSFLQSVTGGVAASPVPALHWQVFTGLMSGIAYAMGIPLQTVCVLVLYLDLRSRREGMDLLVRAQALTEPTR